MEDGGGGGGVDGDRGEGPGAVPMATTLFRCPLCRCSAFAGRRSHLYSAGHQRRLRGVLARLKEKVAAARKMLKRALVVPFDPGEHERQFWCVCCRQEVKLHLSQGSLAVLHGGLLQHMASVEHKKAVYAFWWENRADPSLKSRFLVSSEDYELFKASLSKALDAYEEKEDELIQEVAARIREVEQRRQEVVQAALEQQAETELCNGAATANAFTGSPSDSAFATEEQEQLGPSRNLTFLEGHPGSAYRTVPESEWQEAGQSLTFIGHQEPAEHGNIYTGAKPPWLMEEEGESTAQIGPSYEEFLKEKEKQKLKKLPPNRVGANFDHTSQTGEGWLPSFGRVWNHGRRWQSRHQFKSEAQKHPGPKRKQQKTD
ncbi:coiled-coil domain-containing protein 84 isoform X1 [Lacerta agilis]|uniref:coiled-coil domain-containing protein 84 isoform X1 n=1 Tax=Lacerta agilis TaxID=80427 RepID=UPI001419FB04|nr:coiled-coil domain-containing protein 84 isoform X1 [Lacerta agilis]